VSFKDQYLGMQHGCAWGIECCWGEGGGQVFPFSWTQSRGVSSASEPVVVFVGSFFEYVFFRFIHEEADNHR
jgi:hypothetical protein